MKFVVDALPAQKDCPFSEWHPYPPIMYITAGLLIFLGLDLADIPAKAIIMITGSVCGCVNMLYYYWIDKD